MNGFAIAAIISAVAVLVTAAAGAISTIIRELRATRLDLQAVHGTVRQVKMGVDDIDAAVNDKRTEDPTMRQNVQKLRDRSDRDEP